MRKLKPGFLIAMLTAGTVFLSGCGQVDESLFESNANFSVNINVPYSTTTPLPEYMNVPNQVVIDPNGVITVNDPSILDNSYTQSQKDQSRFVTLSKGDTGDAVKRLQQRLMELGYLIGGTSGVYDAETQLAVKRFEQTYGIMQTGIATPQFQSKLFSKNSPIYGSEAYNAAVISQYTTLQRGAVGSSVYALQHRLKELGYPIYELSGVYDAETENAVRLFSAAYGVESQSIAYIALQKELYSENAIPYAQSGMGQVDSSTVIHVGSVGTQVMQIQNRLNQLGYLEGSTGGVFDAATEEAVRKFEEALGFEPTGTLSGLTIGRLFAADAPVFGETPQKESDDYTDLVEGSSGEEVRRLQNRLIELGYATGAGNGVYGPETAVAVSMFQHYNRLDVSGAASGYVQQVLYSDTALSYQDVLNGKVPPEREEPQATNEVLPTVTPFPEPSADPSTGLRTLTTGCKGDDVRVLQERLDHLGYSCTPDGVFGQSTAALVSKYQKALGAPQTGEASPSFQKYIQTRCAPAKKYKLHKSEQSFTELHLGDTGEAVTELQKRLWKLEFLAYEDVEDSIGTFHDKTYDAVTAAQRAMGYEEPDGIAGIEFQCFIFSKYTDLMEK